MLLHAIDSELERERDVYESTKAILFLGTPHRGCDSVGLAEISRRIVSAGGFDTNHQNIAALAVDSQILEEYHERFLKLHNRKNFEIRTFQEALGMKGTSFANLNKKVQRENLGLIFALTLIVSR